ncbi:hypothetical protein GCM10010510_03400 [Streptomyces anandii JCM 4720]|nr:hypothetical protein GCM10010510_03400 [Streptomyces anandii JCM 4720]
MSPETLVSADASAEGRPVSRAAARSAASSRYRDRARISRKLIAYTAAETPITMASTARVFWSLRPRPPNNSE